VKTSLIEKTGTLSIAAFMLICSALSPHAYSAVRQQPELAGLFEKMRKARFSVGYTAEVKVERLYRGRERTFTKKVVSRPPRTYREELILTPEEKQRLNKMRERMEREEKGRNWSRTRHWNSRFQYERRSEAPFNVHAVRSDLLRSSYTITIRSAEKVAGRDATFISIIPKYQYRPVNRLWIDSETGIILKRELKKSNADDEPLYRETFTSVTYEPVDEKQLEESRKSMEERQSRMRQSRSSRSLSEYRTVAEIPEKLRGEIVVPGVIPEGFVLDKVRIFTEYRGVTYHLVYTDGLLLFSLFQSRGRSVDQNRIVDRSGREQAGRTGMTVLSKRSRNTTFILVGYAQKALLRTVFDSLPGKEERSDRRRYEAP